MKQLSPAEALHKAAAYCSKSEHCISEIEKKLKEWGVEEGPYQEIIKRLISEKFLDESRFCKSFVHDKYLYNRWGKIKILYQLRSKKINESIIYDAFDEVIDPETYKENLKCLLAEKKKSTKGNSTYEIQSKLFRFAQSRGYENDEISKTLKEIYRS